MSPPRKARLCHLFKITGVSGSENHLLTLASHLDRARYDLTFILLVEQPDAVPGYVADLEAVGVTVERVVIRRDVDPLLVWRLARRLRAGGYDVVHTHLIHGDLYGTVAARLAGVPHLVSTKHNDDAFRRRGVYAWLDRQLARWQARIIVISEHLRRFYVQVERLPEAKLVPIHYGLDGAAFRARAVDVDGVRPEWGIPSDAPLAGVVARLDPQKGHTYLLRAWVEVLRAVRDARLLVVGDGRLRPELEAQAGQLSIAGSVTFTGFRPDVPRLMAALDVLVVPSLWEGFGLVMLEAMALSKPVVASRVSAIPEIVVDSQTGLLVPPRDEGALAEAMIELLTDRGRAVEMGQRGRERLEREFSVSGMVQGTAMVYERMLSM